MRMKQIKKSLSFIFCMMLVVAMALFTSGCNGKKTEAPKTQVQEESVKTTESVENRTEENTADTDNDSAGVTILGEGETKFLFTVVDKDGMENAFEIYTNEKIVGDALLKLEMISGEEGAYGLYVKSVNGIVADYDADGTYWAFYINGEYAMSGVDTTTIEEGASYMFKVEK